MCTSQTRATNLRDCANLSSRLRGLRNRTDHLLIRELKNLTDDTIDPGNESGNVDVNRGTSNLSAWAGGERDDSQEHVVLQNWATRVSSAHTDSSGQRASAHVLLVEVHSKVGQGGAAGIKRHNGHLDLLQEGGAGREESSAGLAPSGNDGHSARDGSGGGEGRGLDPIVVSERRLRAKLQGLKIP